MSHTLLRHVALLRGINVGGRNRLPMSDLITVFTEAGCTDVETYIASGNVVVSASDELYARIPIAISDAIGRRRGLSVSVVTRTGEAFANVVAENPWVGAGGDIKEFHVAFLADSPSPESVARLRSDRSPPDEFVVRGRELFLRCPNGIGRSKLTNTHFDAALGTTCTIRNWRTVLKLHDLLRGL